MTFYYPPLDETTIKNLEIVRQLVQAHPGYFLEAPYSQATEGLLTTWFLEQRRALGSVSDLPDVPVPVDNRDPWEMLYEESKALFLQLKTVSARSEGDTNERMQYFRTATALLEKMVSLQERAHSLKEIGDFQRMVLSVMDSVLTPTQRTSVMEQLRPLTTATEESK